MLDARRGNTLNTSRSVSNSQPIHLHGCRELQGNLQVLWLSLSGVEPTLVSRAINCQLISRRRRLFISPSWARLCLGSRSEIRGCVLFLTLHVVPHRVLCCVQCPVSPAARCVRVLRCLSCPRKCTVDIPLRGIPAVRFSGRLFLSFFFFFFFLGASAFAPARRSNESIDDCDCSGICWWHPCFHGLL
jgi:hypothetical protein